MSADLADVRHSPDAWLDRDGAIYIDDGPFAGLPWRIARRKLQHWRVVLRRWWSA
jgi:hypothetical protein